MHVSWLVLCSNHQARHGDAERDRAAVGAAVQVLYSGLGLDFITHFYYFIITAAHFFWLLLLLPHFSAIMPPRTRRHGVFVFVRACVGC